MSLRIDRFLAEYRYEMVINWVRSYSWELVYEQPLFSVLRATDDLGQQSEIVLPKTRDIDDFQFTILQTINKLSIHYKKSLEVIVDEVLNYRRDKLKLSIKSPSTAAGTIPLSHGIKLLDNTREMLSSSLLATLSKRKNFLGQRPDSVNEVLKSVELGQTEEGSYVISVFVPRDGKGSILPVETNSETFSRRALRQIESASIALKAAIEQYTESGNLEVFNETVEDGVSSNFCQSIYEISNQAKTELSFEISYEQKLDREIESSHVEFVQSELVVIKEVADYFRKDLEQPDFTIIGFVTKLHREEGDVVGDVTLTTLIDAKQKNVKIVLDEAKYNKAIAAHKTSMQVRIVGKLIQQLKQTRMIDVVSVEPIEEVVDEDLLF